MSIVGWISGTAPHQFWLAFGVLAVVALAGLVHLFRSIHRSRLLSDTPTSRIRSAAQGYVELEGVVRRLAGEPIIAPLSGLPCVWYRYSVEKTARDPDQDGLFEGAEPIEQGVSDGLFGLDDGTALCVVDPDSAEVYAAREDCWRGRYRRPGGLAPDSPLLRHVGNRGVYRYREARIQDGQRLWAAGRFRTVQGGGFLDTNLQVSQLLAIWKKDRPALLRRFDGNHDGAIDLNEWDAAQQAAETAVSESATDDDAPRDVYVLDCPTDGNPFLLSCRPFPRLTADYSRHALASAACLILSSVALVAALLIRFAG
ncbi:hypothetical protein [Methylotetracoccus oryzae]|uniref:hypothetical protein n=1 Tax=Methylotetracoccus oryzae TaxID=1919059 RepID=UPI00111819AE|nr:hypothetical protein [Methylotetracoccus oryzae]